MEQCFGQSDTAACGRGCPREGQRELQWVQTEELQVSTVDKKLTHF